MEYSNRNKQLSQSHMVHRSKKRIPDLAVIGARIRNLRGDRLQEDFAMDLGVSQGQLSKIERGKMAPTLDLLVAISQLCGKSIDWIVTGHEAKRQWNG